MKKKRWIPVLVIALAAVASIAWLVIDAEKVTNNNELITLIPPEDLISGQPVSKHLKKEQLAPESTEDDDNPFEDDVFQEQLSEVADLYEASARYPVFSQLILNPDATQELKPFEETEVDTPFPSDEGEPTIRLQAATDKFQYFQGDKVQVRLSVSGAPSDVFVKAVAVIAGAQGDTPLAGDLIPADQSLTEFTGEYDLQVVPQQLLSQELSLKVSVTVDDQQLFTTVAFRYAIPSATLVGVPYQRQQGAFLNIPLQYNVSTGGYYFAQGVLEDAASGRPLIQLQAEGNMPQGNSVLMMRAHIQALKAAGSEGPYVLRSVRSYRGADQGETFDAPASSAQRRFEIQGYPFAQYDDVQYQNPDAQESIDFIRGLADQDEN